VHRHNHQALVVAVFVVHTCNRTALTVAFVLLALLLSGSCPLTSGQQTINNLGLDVLTMPQCAGILISYIVICRILAYIGIRFIKW
jgi:hypothetical protein